MFIELEFRLCISGEHEEEQWLIPKQPQGQPPPFYTVYVPLKDAISYLTFHPARAKAKVIIDMEDKADFTELCKSLNSMLGNPPQNLEPLLELLSHKQLLVLKYRCDGLDYKTIGDKMYISAEAVRKHCTRIKEETGKSVKEWIKLCSGDGELFD